MKNLDCFLFDFQDNTKRVYFPGTAVDDGGTHEDARWLSYRDLHSVCWQLDTTVHQIHGIARFYTGLTEHIRILDAPELETYAKDYFRRALENLG